MIYKKYLALIILSLIFIFSSCKEQGSSFVSWRSTSDKTMKNINNAYLNLSADKDTLDSVATYFAEVQGRIFKKSDSLQIVYFGHCYSNTKTAPTMKNSLYTIFKADTMPDITPETTDFTFLSEINDLELDTPYFVRSFAIVKYNSGKIDTGYNQTIISFRTKAENIWFHKIDFNGDARTEATSFVMKNKAYILCGWDGVTLRNDHWEYDPDFDSWAQVSTFAGDARMSAAAFVISDTVYFGTGITNHVTSERGRDMWKWTVSGNMYYTWFRIDSLSEGQERDNCVAFALTNKDGEKRGYIGLGVQNNNATEDIYWYDQASDIPDAPTGASWVQAPLFLGGRRTEAVVSVINNRAIVGSGTNNEGVIKNDFYMLDPTTGISGTWSSIPPSTAPARTNAVAFAIGFTRPTTGDQFNYFYFGTGKDADNKLYRDWWRYDFSTKEWEECSEMREKDDYADPRQGAIAFTIKLNHADFGTVERGFVALGHNGTTYKKDVWEYLP